MSSESTEKLPIKSLKIAISGLKSVDDGARASGILREIANVNTAVVLKDKGQAIVTVPVEFNAYVALEKALIEKGGFQATLIEPLHVTLKVTRADGNADLAALGNIYAAVPGVASAAPEASGDALAVYLDLAQVPFATLEKVATEKGFQTALTSHTLLTIPVAGMTCKKQEQFVESALNNIPGVLRSCADSAQANATVIVAQGTLTAEALQEALKAANPNGNWCPMEHDECDEKVEKSSSLAPEQPVK